MDSEFLCKIFERVKSAAGVKAFLVLTVAARHLDSSADIPFDQLVEEIHGRICGLFGICSEKAQVSKLVMAVYWYRCSSRMYMRGPLSNAPEHPGWSKSSDHRFWLVV